jgi:hypothetical protein
MAKTPTRKAKSEQVVSNSVQRKEFSYSVGGVQLSFTLRVDNSSELRPFLKLLEKATTDVVAEIGNLKN